MRTILNDLRVYDREVQVGLLSCLAALGIGQLASSSPTVALLLVPGIAFVFIAFKWPWVGLFLYIGSLALVPAYVGIVYGPFGAWTPTRGLGVLYAAVLIVRSCLALQRPNVVDMAMCAFVLLNFVPLPIKGIGLTAAIKVGMYTALDFGLPYLAFRAACTSLPRTRRVLAMVTFWAVIVGLFASIEALSGFNPFLDLGPKLTGDEGWSTVIFRSDVQRAQAGFSHPISLGMFAALVLPTSLWLAQYTGSRTRALALLGGVLVIAAALIVTLSRGPWVGAVAALCMGLFMRPRHAGRGRAILALALAAMLALYVTGLTPATSIINATFSPGTDEFANLAYRQDLLPYALSLWSHSPVLGYATLASAAAVSFDDYYLVLLLSLGVVGLAAFVFLMLVVLHRLWSVTRAPDPDDPIAADLAAILSGALIGQLVILGTVAMVGSGPYFFWAFVGLAAGNWATRRATVREHADQDGAARYALASHTAS